MIKILPSIALFFLQTIILLSSLSLHAQPGEQKKIFSRQDSLRGSITPERAWWDVVKYRLFVQPDFNTRTIKGEITITYRSLKNTAEGLRMQIDLQEPMQIDRVVNMDGNAMGGATSGHPSSRNLVFKRDGNVYYIEGAPRKSKLPSSTDDPWYLLKKSILHPMAD